MGPTNIDLNYLELTFSYDSCQIFIKMTTEPMDCKLNYLLNTCSLLLLGIEVPVILVVKWKMDKYCETHLTMTICIIFN